MKKRIGILSILVLIVISFSCISVSGEIAPVYDGAGIFTEDQLEELSSRLLSIRSKYDLDVAVAVTEELYSKTAEASADDIYDEFGFGTGANDDGILFYISLNTRDFHFSTHAYGLTVFTDYGIEHLTDTVLPYLRDGDYYGACVKYAETADELLEMASKGTPYDYENESEGSGGTTLYIIAACLSLIIALVKTSKKTKKMKTAVKQQYADSYVKPGSTDISLSRDIFLYSHTSRSRRADDSSSSRGGSSSHTSSSGRTHGGGGGKF